MFSTLAKYTDKEWRYIYRITDLKRNQRGVEEKLYPGEIILLSDKEDEYSKCLFVIKFVWTLEYPLMLRFSTAKSLVVNANRFTYLHPKEYTICSKESF